MNIIDIIGGERIILPSSSGNDGDQIIYNDIKGLYISFYGDNNIVTFHENTDFQNCFWSLGKSCRVSFGKTEHHIKRLNISAYKSFKSKFIFGDNLSCVAADINARESSNVIIGNDCMLSSGILIWNSDAHTIYDIDTLMVKNHAHGVIIGNHVWIGTGVAIFNGVQIADNNIIGGRTVLRSRFLKQNTIIVGNPASVVREGVNWDRRTPYNYDINKVGEGDLEYKKILIKAFDYEKDNNFMNAIQLSDKLISLNPKNNIGYELLARIYLKYGDLISAEKICTDCINNTDNHLKSMITLVEISMKKKDFNTAISQLENFRNKFPAHGYGYSRASEAYMKLGYISQSYNLCHIGLNKVDSPFDILIQLATLQFIEGNFSGSLKQYEEIKNKFPKHPKSYTKYSSILMELQKIDKALNILYEGKKNCPDNFNIIYLLCTCLLMKKDEQSLLASLFLSIELCEKYKNNLQSYLILFTTILNLIKVFGDKYFYLYNFLIYNFLQRFPCKKQQIHNEDISIIFYTWSITALKFFIPVIKCFNFNSIKIFVNKKSIEDDDFINQNSLHDYIICYDSKVLRNADAIIFDYTQIKNISNINSKCIYICLLHSTDYSLPSSSLQSIDMLLISSKKQMKRDSLINCEYFSNNNIKYLSKLDKNAKCEISYTGPYHIGDFFQKSKQDKNTIKNELKNNLGITLDERFPLISIFEDEISILGQIIYAAKKISKFANVIIKPLVPISYNIQQNLPGNIYILDDFSFAPNLLRFSSDFILAGYSSGTFATSVMLGINIIPYYSRMVKTKKLNSNYSSYKYRIPNTINEETPSKDILKNIFNKQGYLFDLLDIQKIKDSILGNNYYLNWYHTNLKKIQSDVFGHYYLDESPQKTAEYIMRFAKEGTLGKDCSAVYLKEQFFRQ